jgi:glucosamine-6-phosphate deaminase
MAARMADTLLRPVAPAPVRTLQIDALAVRIYARLEEMAVAAALAAGEYLRDTLARQGRAAAILASATSQEKFLEVLTGLTGLDWARITLFHMDEYLGISAEHPASFRRFLRERVEEKVKPEVFHYVRGDAPLPLDECARYSGLLQAQPIDLCCLGIGENGHVAFNDPPVADFQDRHRVKIVKLDQACRQQQVGEGAFPTLDAVPQYAFTLTVPALCSARKMICAVPEKRKAQAVKDALRGPVSTACPASILRQQPHCTLYLDCDSAGLV